MSSEECSSWPWFSSSGLSFVVSPGSIKVPLTPNFFSLFSKRIHNLVKIKKKLSKSIKSSPIYEGLKLSSSGSRPRERRSET